MKDTAVSSVIGVMLMLSITLLIAAVLLAYASGFVEMDGDIPSTELTVYTTGSNETFQIVFEHRGGDAICPAECKVTTRMVGLLSDVNTNTFILSELSADVWTAGTRITTTNLTHTAEILSIDTDTLNISILRSRGVNIAIYHMPSSTQIFEKTILLAES